MVTAGAMVRGVMNLSRPPSSPVYPITSWTIEATQMAPCTSLILSCNQGYFKRIAELFLALHSSYSRKMKDDQRQILACHSSCLSSSPMLPQVSSSAKSGQGRDHLDSRDRMARVGATKVNVPPWMMGRRHPMTDCSKVTIPDTKNMVEMMYPLAGSSSLKIMHLCCQLHIFVSVCDAPHAQGGAENEGYGEGAPYHGQEMLEAQEQTHVPGGNIVNFVGNVQASFFFFLLA